MPAGPARPGTPSPSSSRPGHAASWCAAGDRGNRTGGGAAEAQAPHRHGGGGRLGRHRRGGGGGAGPPRRRRARQGGRAARPHHRVRAGRPAATPPGRAGVAVAVREHAGGQHRAAPGRARHARLARRAAVKVLFNAGMYGAALGPAVLLYHATAAAGAPLAPRSVVAMAFAVAVFALLNLLLISQLIATVEERSAGEVVGESSKTSTFTFLGNASVGLIGVTLWLRAPVVLPAVLLPVATLYLAYRSAARETEERDRFQNLYEIGQSLSSSLDLDDVLPVVLPRIARLFGAAEARLLFASGVSRPFGAIQDAEGFRYGP